MKKTITRFLMVAAMAVSSLCAVAGPFKIGPVVGVNVNRFTTNADIFSADNRCGFTGGVMAKFTVPLIGVGADLSVMYARRSAEMQAEVNGATATTKLNYDYIAVPLHVRYDIGLPVVGKFFAPAIFTGPNFAFRCSKDVVNDYKANKYNVGWDFGIALTFIDHIQIAGSYTLGMNKAVKYIGVGDAGIQGRTDGWTITAAYLF